MLTSRCSADPDEVRRRLRAARYVGDPLADDLVDAFRRLPGRKGAALLDRALAEGADAVPEAPDALRALLDDASRAPSWLDPALVDAGATSFWRVGAPALVLTLTYGSLAYGYQYADLSRPLAATGRLERMASRRLGETSRWLLAVTTPGGMRPGAAGWSASVRVRVVHALVRDRLRRSGTWDEASWGVPISATAAAVTAIAGFDVVPARAMADLGVRTTAAEREARTALWRWVGHVMGVPEGLLPEDHAAAVALSDAVPDVLDGPDADGTRLMRALLRHGLPLEGLLPRRAVGPARAVGAPVLAAVVRRWMDGPTADVLGVPRSPIGRLVPLLRPVSRAQAAVLATGVLGGEARVAQAQIGALRRLLDAAGEPATPVTPAATQGPALHAVRP
jgi:hypothetical protein